MSSSWPEYRAEFNALVSRGASCYVMAKHFGVSAAELRKGARELGIKLPKTGLHGFASMDPEKRRAICSMGGKAVPNDKRSFSKSKDLAKAAGRAGGLNVRPEDRSFSRDPLLASKAGRKGGQTSRGGQGRAA